MSSNENDDETMSQNKIIKELNVYNWQIKTVWGANKIIKKTRRSKRFWPYNDHDDK